MLHNVLVATPVMLLCLLMQGAVVSLCLRRYARFKHTHRGKEPLWMDVLLLS